VTSHTFPRCGHPATEDNTRFCGGRPVCRTCRNAYQRAYTRKDREEDGRQRYTRHRLSYLPRQLEAARHKVAMLENEARRYGMTDLLEQP